MHSDKSIVRFSIQNVGLGLPSCVNIFNMMTENKLLAYPSLSPTTHQRYQRVVMSLAWWSLVLAVVFHNIFV